MSTSGCVRTAGRDIRLAGLARFVSRHHIAIIAVSVVVSLAAALLALRLRVVTDFAEFLPAADTSVRELNRIKQRMGVQGSLSIIVVGDNPVQAGLFLDALADTLSRHPLVAAVSRGESARFFARHRLLYMDTQDLETIYERLLRYLRQERVKQSPLFAPLEDQGTQGLDFHDLEAKYRTHVGPVEVDNYGDPADEENGLVLRIYPTGAMSDVTFSRRLLGALDGVIAEVDPSRFGPTVHCLYEGRPKGTLYRYDVMLGDLRFTALLSGLGVLLLTVARFRNAPDVLALALPTMMSLTWTFGLAQIVVGSLNQITIGLLAILTGLGAGLGIPVLAHYHEARRRGHDADRALEQTLVKGGGAVIPAGLTLAAGHYSLLLTDFEGLAQLGLIGGTGILLATGAMVVICPALLTFAERCQLSGRRNTTAAAHRQGRGRFPSPKIALTIVVFLTAYSVYHIPDVAFEYDFDRLRPDTPVEAGSQLPPRHLQTLGARAVVLAETPEAARQVVAAVKQTQQRNGEQTMVRAVRSVYSLLPAEQDEKLRIIARIRHLVDQATAGATPLQRTRFDSLRPLLDVENLGIEDLPAELTRRFTDSDGKVLNLVAIYPSTSLRDGRQAMAFEREVGTIRTPSGDQYDATGAHIVFARALRLVLHDSLAAAGIALLTVTVILAIDLRRLSDIIQALSILLNCLLWVVGVIYACGLPLNLYSVAMLPALVGMGITGSLHVLHRLRDAGDCSARFMPCAPGATLAIAITAFMVGFAGLTLAHDPALRSIGVVCVVGLACSLVCSCIVLPALAQVCEDVAPLTGRVWRRVVTEALSRRLVP